MRKKIIVLVLILIFSVSPVVLIDLNFNNLPNSESYSETPNEEDKYNDFMNPIASTSDWVSADKPAPFVAGTQDNEWDDDNIKFNDGQYDSTNFVIGDSYSTLQDTVSPATVPAYTGKFGSTDGSTNGGDWWFTNAYRDNDGVYFYLESTWGNDYPGTIYMKWGEYQNFEVNIHPHVHTVRIDYEVWADSALGVLDASSNLQVRAYDNVGNYVTKTVATTPGHRTHYYQTLTISSGAILTNIKNNNGYIKHMEVRMSCNEELWTTTWINIDYVKIYYDYYKYKVDFKYVLDFGGAGFTDVTQFDIKIDLVESKALTALYLYDYNMFEWDAVGLIGTAGLHTFSITVDADNYISDSDEMEVRIVRYGYYDGNVYTDYQIKVDMISIEIPPPDPPDNIEVDQKILNISITWDIPNDYGVEITHYNIYRGIVEGGVKYLIGTAATNEYNDDVVTAGERYYYVISASNVVGEGGNSTEFSGKAYDTPFIEWTKPFDGARIVFPYNKSDQYAHWVTFNFKYDWAELDDAKLFLNGFDYGNVWNKNSSRIYPFLNGPVTAQLRGYNKSILVATDTISLTFVRIDFEIEEMLDFGTEIHGDKLYLILHDPHGDESYSGFTESTTISIGFGYEVSYTESQMVSLGMSYNLFGIDLGASTETTTTSTSEEGFDFRLERSQTTSLTSNQLDDDADYIGPGYGDVYWGESWIFKWVYNATYREYSNGTDIHEDPKIFYGIIRGVETLASDANAPEEWKEQNPYHNAWADVDWDRWLYCDGGIEYTSICEVSGTLTRTYSFTVVSDSTNAVGAGLAGSWTITESSKIYSETSLGQTYQVDYRIFDNENTDRIVQGVGIDRRFGTYIFNSSSLFCETSEPYEHHTFDYIPPDIAFPSIDYDTNDDLQGPCNDDSPTITVDIYDEGGIQEALVRYSVDDGTNWDFVYLTEDINFPGTWYASIPAQEVDTEVLWYVIAWDYQGSNSTKMNGVGIPFNYTVKVKEELPPEIPDIPGYPLMPFISFSLVAFVSVTIIFYKKRRKIYKE